jgi:thioredoxin reductase (NADPH)
MNQHTYKPVPLNNQTMRKVIILGSGMAGLTAAIYAGRDNLEPLIISGYEPGGQITTTTTVENFPGFPEGILGTTLAENMKKQAERFGTTFVDSAVESVEKKEDFFVVKTTDESFEAHTIIIATGASAKRLGLAAEEKYWGRGVHTCATCDGFFYKGKEIAVIGGGDSACEEASFLSRFATKVTIIHRKDTLRASQVMQDRVHTNPKITFLWDTAVDDIIGDGKVVTHLKLKNLKTNTDATLRVDGMFLAIGHEPNTRFLKGVADIDPLGFVMTTKHVLTTIPGMFAAGDVADHRYRQAITAAGMGCQAAIEVRKYLEEKE